jgi:hypothetical protein
MAKTDNRARRILEMWRQALRVLVTGGACNAWRERHILVAEASNMVNIRQVVCCGRLSAYRGNADNHI